MSNFKFYTALSIIAIIIISFVCFIFIQTERAIEVQQKKMQEQVEQINKMRDEFKPTYDPYQ